VVWSWLVLLTACGDAGKVGDTGETGETGGDLCDSDWAEGVPGPWIVSVAALPELFDPTAPVRLSTDGHIVALGSADPDVEKLETGQVLEIHDLDCGEVVRVEGIEVLDLAVSADGSTVAFVEPTLRESDPDGSIRYDRIHVYDVSTGEVERVDVDPNGVADEMSEASLGSLSADGRFVAFVSNSALVPEDTDTDLDVFVRDRLMGTTELISNSPPGHGIAPVMSDDGRFVAFHAYDPELFGVVNVLIRDRETGTTELLYPPVGADAGSDRAGMYPDISGDGRHVVFESEYRHLSDDDDGNWDVYYVDRETQTMQLISVDGPSTLEMHSFSARISDDGRKVVFATGGYQDPLRVAIHDRDTGTTTRLDEPLPGLPDSAGKSKSIDISGDGTWVAFLGDGNFHSMDPGELGLHVFMAIP
jgi:Tol biopolymer transport system component